MSTRAEKALKNQKEKHHSILRELVQEVPNKTCADCLAKGPRWSSWSLGVFMCIRCAGIHRNLGVHISKVKSIDLDSWNPEQIEKILQWGNKRAAEYYECYLPKDFVRPQTNHALEAFIRNKYEKKLYIKKDGEPEPNPQSKLDRLKTVPKENTEKEKKSVTSNHRQRRPERKKEAASPNNTILNIAKQDNLSPVQKVADDHHVKSHSMNDLLSLDHPSPQPVAAAVKPSASSDDLLNFGSWSDPVATNQQSANQPFQTTDTSNDFFQSGGNQQAMSTTVTTTSAKSTKESILSLYSTGVSNPQQQQQVYGIPGGVYMPQQPMQSQPNMSYGHYPQAHMQNQMNAMNQLNSQMQQMNFNQQQQQAGFKQQQVGFQQMRQMNPGGMQAGYNMQQQYSGQLLMRNPLTGNNQMNSYNMQQQQGLNNFMGQNVMTNGSLWSGNQQDMMGIRQQQPIATNGLMTGGHNMNVNSNMGGHTMNNQLWN